MPEDWANMPVSQLVRQRQDRAAVFEAFGIDFCCGGATTLADACREQAVSLQEVTRAVKASDAAPVESAEADWARESLQSLVDHIVARHHSYLREQLPRIGALLEKVIARHADKHASLIELRGIYAGLCHELFQHMMKEERVLFPYIRLLEEALREGQPAPRFCCGSIQQPIQVMEDEHQSAGDALKRMRELTLGFQPPDDACDAYRKLMNDLRDLERDLHLHIHKENNILFPRAAAGAGQPGETRERSATSRLPDLPAAR
jgi:regulator of cell morphogenesis and NO signaling